MRQDCAAEPTPSAMAHEGDLAMPTMIEYDEASPEVRAVYEEIARARGIDPRNLNNAWKVAAVHPGNLRRMWERGREVMAPGALDGRTKELIYFAVAISQQCDYCVASHGYQARRKGVTEEEIAELIAVVGLAVEGTRLAAAYRTPVDEDFSKAFG